MAAALNNHHKINITQHLETNNSTAEKFVVNSIREADPNWWSKINISDKNVVGIALSKCQNIHVPWVALSMKI